jgi:hypothetical protein
MTSPDPETTPYEAEAFEDEPRENPLIGWAKAIVYGIGDTAKDMLDAGREGAREAMDEGWDRFDRKTKHRRD